MSHVQKKKRQVKFKDQVQVLEFKKKQAVTNLLRRIGIYDRHFARGNG